MYHDTTQQQRKLSRLGRLLEQRAEIARTAHRSSACVTFEGLAKLRPKSFPDNSITMSLSALRQCHTRTKPSYGIRGSCSPETQLGSCSHPTIWRPENCPCRNDAIDVFSGITASIGRFFHGLWVVPTSPNSAGTELTVSTGVRVFQGSSTPITDSFNIATTLLSPPVPNSAKSPKIAPSSGSPAGGFLAAFTY